MTDLLWQTTFLLAAAFFFGAVLACGLKRRFYYGAGQRRAKIPTGVSTPSTTPDASQPKIEVAARAAPEGARFERALSSAAAGVATSAPSPSVAPVAAPRSVPAQPAPKPAEPRPVAPSASVPSASVPSASVPSAPVPSAPSPVAAPVKAPVPQSAPAPAAGPTATARPPAQTVAAATPSPAAPAADAKPGIPRVSVATGSGAPVKPEEGGAGPSDDLTRIRGIDPVLQARLKELGLRRYRDLASLTVHDVKGMSEALGLKSRVGDENWLGQAQVLAEGGETFYSRRLDRGIPIPATVEPAAAAPAPAPAPQPPPAAPAPAPAPSAETMPGIPRVSVATGSGAPVKFGEGGAGPSDDLTRIRGIDPVLQARLKDLGLRRLEELGRLTAHDVKGLGEVLGINTRVADENWVGQAKILAEGGETYYSRRLDRGIPVPASAEPAAAAEPPAAAAPDASSPAAMTGDVAALRSVRSAALLGEDARGAPAKGDADDLKRIRGIGVLIEKKLNSLGILSYEQVANWTGADIDRISGILDFKGRIERENWIEQARILATGGQTEFSRRGER